MYYDTDIAPDTRAVDCPLCSGVGSVLLSNPGRACEGIDGFFEHVDTMRCPLCTGSGNACDEVATAFLLLKSSGLSLFETISEIYKQMPGVVSPSSLRSLAFGDDLYRHVVAGE